MDEFVYQYYDADESMSARRQQHIEQANDEMKVRLATQAEDRSGDRAAEVPGGKIRVEAAGPSTSSTVTTIPVGSTASSPNARLTARDGSCGD